MEDIKWFIKKFGIIFVILLVMIVSVGIFFEKNVRKSSAEETWEKPVQISDIEFWQEESDYERENEDNSPYWIIPQSKSLLSEEESKNIQNEALTAAELVKNASSPTSPSTSTNSWHLALTSTICTGAVITRTSPPRTSMQVCSVAISVKNIRYKQSTTISS